ncbi:hypothetical protein GGR56DRAFT_75692 [Xylariaceae sp. FL0804]|nr:hypothetical protein GGR56DRAFT_75692 [Xylariaceae sp. FL0804]
MAGGSMSFRKSPLNKYVRAHRRYSMGANESGFRIHASHSNLPGRGGRGMIPVHSRDARVTTTLSLPILISLGLFYLLLMSSVVSRPPPFLCSPVAAILYRWSCRFRLGNVRHMPSPPPETTATSTTTTTCLVGLLVRQLIITIPQPPAPLQIPGAPEPFLTIRRRLSPGCRGQIQTTW